MLLAGQLSILQFRRKVHYITSRLTSLKASFRANLYTKKQNKFHFVKPLKLPTHWLIEVEVPDFLTFPRISRKRGWNFNISPCDFFTHGITGLSSGAPTAIPTVIKFQIFSLAVRNCTGFFVTLWKHRRVYLHSAGMEHRFFTAKWYDRHHRHRKYGFHIRKDVHIDIARCPNSNYSGFG